MNKIWMTAIVIVLLAGCAAVDNLQENLRSRSGELIYLHNSVKITEKQGGTVKIGSFIVEDVLPPYTTANEQSGFFLPLLVVNVWKYSYESSLGSAQIGNDYKQFIRESFIEELKRSCKFGYVEDNGDMAIDLKIKAITMAAPIKKNGVFVFIGYGFSYQQTTSAGPLDVVVRADVVLKKDGKELFSQEFEGISRTGILKGKKLDLGDYTTAMIEGLSLALKGLNENIAKEINKI